LVRSQPVINGKALFESVHTPQYIPTEGGGYEYVNEAEYDQRSRILETALIEGFKASALQNFQNIRDSFAIHLGNLSESDRFRLYGELNAVGVLPYLGADAVGRSYAQEIAGFLVHHENQTYFQYGLYEDLETASMITDVASLGTAATSRPARYIGKAAFRRMASGGRQGNRIKN
jgi:hypothetical protein